MASRKTARDVLLLAVKARKNAYGGQAALAEVLGVAPETLSRWLTDKAPFNPTLDLVERMVGRLGIDASSLFDGIELPEPAPPRGPIDVEDLEALRERLGEISTAFDAAIKLLPSGKRR